MVVEEHSVGHVRPSRLVTVALAVLALCGCGGGTKDGATGGAAAADATDEDAVTDADETASAASAGDDDTGDASGGEDRESAGTSVGQISGGKEDSSDESEESEGAGGTAEELAPQMTSAGDYTLKLDALAARDPHFYLFGADVTERPILGTDISINSTLQSGLELDEDGDDVIDVSILATLSGGLFQDGSASLSWIDGICPADEPRRCMVHPDPGVDAQWDVELRTEGDCDLIVEGSLSGYEPGVDVPSAPCFVSTDEQEVTIALIGIEMEMKAVRISGSVDEDDPGKIRNGLLAGFVEREAAGAAMLPSVLSLFGDSILNLIDTADMDAELSPTGNDGFWLYLNFGAGPVEVVD